MFAKTEIEVVEFNSINNIANEGGGESGGDGGFGS